MDAKVEPSKKKKKTKSRARPPLSVSFSSLPDELVVNCLARVSKSYYRSLSLVSKNFCSLLSPREIYAFRSQIGTTEPCLYLCLQSSPTYHRWFTLEQTLITYGGEIKDRLSLVPIKPFSSDSPAPSKSTTVAVGSEIYQIGKRTSAVLVLDCRSHTWRRAPNMNVARKHAKSVVSLDEKIYVLGGCSRTDESMNWGEVFDLKTQTWKPLPSPSYGFNSKHKVIVLGGRLYVFTKYKKYAYDPKEERWEETLELGSGLCLARPWCVIDDVMFNDYYGHYFWWYGSSSGTVLGLSDLYKCARKYRMIQLVNYGGKLVIIWHDSIECSENKKIWCAVIKLEKRFSNFGLEIWGGD